jgi:hypothetical protein
METSASDQNLIPEEITSTLHSGNAYYHWTHNLPPSPLQSKYNFTCSFVLMWNFVAHKRVRMRNESAWEMGVEENILTEER